jgi:catechol 2,3-dioxygenase-like lactoylglutathione lyase family enzyme
MKPSAHMHHVHLFAKDIDETIAWYQRNLAAEVKFDGDFGGARNVFMQIGSGRINLYDQPPRGVDATAGGPAGGRRRTGAYHHVGIQTDNLAALRERLLNNGVQFRSEIREFGSWR